MANYELSTITLLLEDPSSNEYPDSQDWIFHLSFFLDNTTEL